MPHALIITGVVVAFSATALAVALVLRLADAARGDRAKDDGDVSADWLLVLLLMLPVMGLCSPSWPVGGVGRTMLGGASGTIGIALLPRSRRSVSHGIFAASGGKGTAVHSSAAGRRRSGWRCGRTALPRRAADERRGDVRHWACSHRAVFAAHARDGLSGAAARVLVLLLSLWGGLNAVVLGRDLFTLYVALELLTFAAVPLVCLDGRAETLAAALRYLLFALLGSVLYLLGTVLLYGAYGMLDIALLAARDAAGAAPPLVAGALMTVGLLAKTALFPLHLWLPPAHAGAPPPASAVLSALVVKGVLLPDPAALVRCHAGALTLRRRNCLAAGRGGDPLRQHRGAAAGAAEASDRLLDRGADRLSLPDVPAGVPHPLGATL